MSIKPWSFVICFSHLFLSVEMLEKVRLLSEPSDEEQAGTLENGSPHSVQGYKLFKLNCKSLSLIKKLF